MRKFKFVLLGVAGGVVVACIALVQVPSFVDPSVWRPYAETIGLRPQTTVIPVVWRWLVSLGWMPNRISALAVGLLVFAIFDVLWRMMALLVCPQDESRNWWRLTIPLIAFLGSALAVFSEPVWRLTLAGSPVVMTLALLALSCDLFLVSFFTGVVFDFDGNRIGWFEPIFNAYAAFLLSGLLFFETPVTLALPILFVIVHGKILSFAMDGRYREYPEGLQIFATKGFSTWIAFLFWAIGIMFAIAVSVFQCHHGDILRHLVEMVRGVSDAASPLGWVLWTCCVLIPFLVVCRLAQVLRAQNWQMKFGLGAVVSLVGLCSVALVSPLARGDWAFVPSSLVRSSVMQSLGAVLSAQVAALALALFAYFAFHFMPRNSVFRASSVCGVGLAAVMVLGVAVMGIPRPSAQQVRQAIVDALEETVREAKGLSWIFTDGSADIGIEIVARRHGQNLQTRPLVTDKALLHDWVVGNSSNLQASAVQAGFEFWKRERKQPPVASGLLSRYDWPKNERERGIALAKELETRMMTLSRAGAVVRETDPFVRNVFTSVLRWLSRLAAQRNDVIRETERSE